MRRQINFGVIEIDCEDETCGDCHALYYDNGWGGLGIPFCGIFYREDPLVGWEKDNIGGACERLSECLEKEIK